MSLDEDLRFPISLIPCSLLFLIVYPVPVWLLYHQITHAEQEEMKKKKEYSTKCTGEAKASPNPNRLAKFCLQIAPGWMWNLKCLKVWSLGGLEDYCVLRKQKLLRWHKSLEVSVEVWEFSSLSFLFSKQPMSTIWAAASCPCCQSCATMRDCTLKCETKWSCSPISYL